MSAVSRDRRELWWLEGFLSVNGTTDAHRDRRLRLYRYLCETCQHEQVSDVSGWGETPKGTRQCRLCNRVWLPGDGGPRATE